MAVPSGQRVDLVKGDAGNGPVVVGAVNRQASALWPRYGSTTRSRSLTIGYMETNLNEVTVNWI